MITVDGLTKRYGSVTAVEGLSFTVEPGAVTGFIGPNGSGKSTTMRMILGLDKPTSGRALINGQDYASLPVPAQTVGAVLDPHAIHQSRTVAAHLRWTAKAIGISPARIDSVLEEVDLAKAGRKRIRELSLGMRQRLAIAVALLGRPSELILDEPLNGLDPQGIIWIRGLLKNIAAEGGTVLVSSHLMNEMQETADHVVLISEGQLVASLGMAELREHASGMIRVGGPDIAALRIPLENQGASVVNGFDGTLSVSGIDPTAIGRTALEEEIILNELTPERNGLEQTFMALTKKVGDHP